MKERLDILLVKKGLFENREEAKAVILAGLVTVNGKLIDKPDSKFPEDTLIELKNSLPYVSKGGFKLKKALDEFSLGVKDFIVMDIGASTGGFTDCLLQEGVKKVYAVDVGKGLLHEKLREDKRVILMERINARYLKEEDIPEKLDLITIDVSFISILKIFPRLKPLLKKEGKVLSLIKPQFEAGSKDVSRGGIVKKDDVHLRVIENIRENTKNLGFFLENITYYISKEGKGNIEYPALFSQIDCGDILIEPVVEEAFKNWDLVLKK